MEIKCNKCKHNQVCRHKSDMEKLNAELKDKERLLENFNFSIKVDCKHYIDEKTSLNYPQGVR